MGGEGKSDTCHTYTKKEILALHEIQQGALCRTLRVNIKLSPHELLKLIGFEDDMQQVQRLLTWEVHGKVPWNEQIMDEYFRALGIQV